MESHTVVNDWLFDEVMPKTGHAAFKVVCAVVRKTWGFTKEWDEISFSQFIGLTGISGRNNISNGIQEAIDKGFIEREKWGAGFRYRPASSNETILDYVKQLLNDTSTGNETLPNEQLASNEKLHTKVKDIHTQGACEVLPEPVATEVYLQPLITAVAQISKETYWAKTRADFDDLALVLFGWDATPETVSKFGQAWAKHGYYTGKPSLTTIANEYRAWLRGDFPSKNKQQAGATNGHKKNGSASEDAAIWQLVMDNARRGDTNFGDERILNAVKKTDWGEIQRVSPGSFRETQLRKIFFEVYHEQSATTTA